MNNILPNYFQSENTEYVCFTICVFFKEDICIYAYSLLILLLS